MRVSHALQASYNTISMTINILSSVKDATTSDFVYSALSFYGRHRGGSLCGSWFVSALDPLGVKPGAIRQTLYRMEHSGALETTRVGRNKFYAPSPTTLAIMDAGLERIWQEPEEWDGRWTLVQFSFAAEDRTERDLAREVLQAEGFGALGPGLYLHPHDRSQRILQALRAMKLDQNVTSFRARLTNGEDSSLADRIWDTNATAHAYRCFLERFQEFAGKGVTACTDAEAFALRFAVVFSFLRISWEDPELPAALSGEEPVGSRARALTKKLYETLTVPALRYCDQITASVGG